MDIGLLTDSVEDLTFDQTLDLANEVGLSCVEFAAGNWSTSPHIDVPALSLICIRDICEEPCLIWGQLP